MLRSLLGKWELQKRSFDGTGDLVLDLPAKLALLWRDYKRTNYERYGAEVRGCAGAARACVCAAADGCRRVNGRRMMRTTTTLVS